MGSRERGVLTGGAPVRETSSGEAAQRIAARGIDDPAGKRRQIDRRARFARHPRLGAGKLEKLRHERVESLAARLEDPREALGPGG